MISDTDWEPTAADITWQESMLLVMKTNATWAVPNSRSVFAVNNATKKFTLVHGSPDHETNRRIAKVFKLLNYVETEVIDDNNEPLEPPTSSSESER